MEINSVADLYKIGFVVSKEAKDSVLSSNWLKFSRSTLPKIS